MRVVCRDIVSVAVKNHYRIAVCIVTVFGNQCARSVNDSQHVTHYVFNIKIIGGCVALMNSKARYTVNTVNNFIV